MSQPISFDRPGDPIYHTIVLRHVVELPVLGVTVRYESNSAAALQAVEQAFGVWRGLLQDPELIDAGQVRVRLIARETRSSTPRPPCSRTARISNTPCSTP